MKKVLLLGCVILTAQMLSAARGIINKDNVRYRADARDSSGSVHRFYIESGETSNLIPTPTGDITHITIEPATAPDTGAPSGKFVDVSNVTDVVIKDGKVQQ